MFPGEPQSSGGTAPADVPLTAVDTSAKGAGILSVSSQRAVGFQKPEFSNMHACTHMWTGKNSVCF